MNEAENPDSTGAAAIVVHPFPGKLESDDES